MRNRLDIRQSLLAIALVLGTATTAFAAPPAKPASPPAATTSAHEAKAAPAATAMAAPKSVASASSKATAARHMARNTAKKRCEQRNKIGHCNKWVATKSAANT